MQPFDVCSKCASFHPVWPTAVFAVVPTLSRGGPKVTRKSQSILALACLGLLGMASSANACSLLQWNGGTSATAPTAGKPTDAVAVPRYSGICGSLSTATGQFVIDNTPATEAAYRVRFYVFTGIASGTATVFQALNNSNAPAITVD